MEKILNYGLVGFGPVNRQLFEMLSRDGSWNLKWIARKSGLYELTSPQQSFGEWNDSSLVKVAELKAIWRRERSRNLDVVFVAISSSGKGDEAFGYIRHFQRLKIPVVSCEKAALGFLPGKILRYGERFGYNAAVGGNTGVLDAVRRDPFGVTAVTAVANTSLNLLRQLVVSGISWPLALRKVAGFGFMESGDVLFELRDALLKGVILFNEVARPREKLPFSLLKLERDPSQNTIERLLTLDYACVIRIKMSSAAICAPRDPPAKFTILSQSLRGWHLEIAFEHVSNLPFPPPEGDTNTFWLKNAIGEERVVFGQGAGARPTAGMMFTDARNILGFN